MPWLGRTSENCPSVSVPKNRRSVNCKPGTVRPRVLARELGHCGTGDHKELVLLFATLLLQVEQDLYVTSRLEVEGVFADKPESKARCVSLDLN